MPKVSVIIAVYNVEEYISNCLDSIINQTFEDIEILCVDDASTDKSVNIISGYMKKDDRVKLIRLSINSGPGVARNTAMHVSEGEYISFIDSDDYVQKDYIEVLYNTAKKYDADMVFTNNIYTVKYIAIKPYYHNRISEWKSKFEKSWNEGVSTFNVNTPEKENTPEYPLGVFWNKIYKNSFLKNNGITISSYRVAEDVEMFYKVLACSPKIAYNNEAKYYYVQRKDSTVNNIGHSVYKDSLKVFENIFNFYKEKNANLLKDSSYYNFRSFLFTFDNYKSSDKDNFYKEAHELMKSLDAEIDKEKYPFISYALHIMKTYPNYADYDKKIDKVKNGVYSLAWWIPSLDMREKFKKSMLDSKARKNYSQNS